MKENKKIKIIGTIIGIVLFVILTAGFTFAGLLGKVVE